MTVTSEDNYSIGHLIEAIRLGDVYLTMVIVFSQPFLLHQHFYSISPLEVAVLSGHIDIVKFLIKYGADVNVKSGDRSLYERALQLEQYEIAEELLANGATVDKVDPFYRFENEAFALKTVLSRENSEKLMNQNIDLDLFDHKL